MKIDFGTLAFGYKLLEGTNTPNWATSLGQGKDYKIKTFTDESDTLELLKGMVYSSVPLKTIKTKLGRGGKTAYGNDDDTPIVIAAVFKNVFINNTKIENGQYIIIITKDQSQSHYGRLKLKYGPSNSYTDSSGNEYSNEVFWKTAKEQLSLTQDSCLFVYDISVKEQDTLNLKTIVVNEKESMVYSNSQELHSTWEKLLGKTDNIWLIENSCNLPQNRIISGAPGTGKSFKYETEKDEYFSEYQYERVTFHPAYSYAHFFGCYKPVNGAEGIEYKFVPGPFVRVWLKAMADPEHNYLLLIEEINRAEVAAVFGDVFQLLDRKDGISQYPIDMSEDLREYIASGEWQENIKTSIEEIDTSQKMIIPQNMFIWATMNSADQGVYPMDTAFKRRWDYEYMPLDNKDVEEKLDKRDIKLVRETAGNEYQVQRFTWNEVRMAINNFLSGANINEDKLMGPFFLSDSVVGAGRDAEDEIEFWEKFEEAFQNKVLLYLFEDAGKSKRPTLFEGAKPNHNRYSGIREEFANKGMRIFHEDISSKVRYKSIADEDKQQEQNNEVETNEGSQP
ncbi:MAG: AAA family ATPase [Anaerovibrio sp.]|nr:AAA family ATPase [Anaerovibrio sp.]